MVLVWLIIFYFIIVWIVARLVVPHLGFRKELIPESIPTELSAKIFEYNQFAKGNREFLELAYSYVTSKYTGSRLKTVTQFWRAFGNVFYKTPGFMPCTGQNYLLRTILIKSGRFTEDDVKVVIVPLNLFIHQYLKVRIDNEWLDVDPWSHFLGIPIGKKSAFIG